MDIGHTYGTHYGSIVQKEDKICTLYKNVPGTLHIVKIHAMNSNSQIGIVVNISVKQKK